MIKEYIHKQDLAGIVFVNRKKIVKEGGEWKGNGGEGQTFSSVEANKENTCKGSKAQ